MKLLTLSITNFGKFSNKTIDLNPGLNLIEGLNETGKTTIHAFIEAILYGFYDKNVKVRRLLNTYHRYIPNQGVYGGSITLSLNKVTYRIERDLTKGLNQTLRIYNAKTGDDLTSTLDIDPTLKTVDMEKFLGMPYRLYQNTLSIKQMAAETSQDAEGDLYSKIKNLLSSKNDALRPHLALEKLKKEKDSIGTTSPNSKKPYALNLKAIETLTKEKQTTLEVHETVLADKEALEKLKQDKTTKQIELTDVEKALKKIENTLNKKRYDKIDSLNSERDTLSAKLASVTNYQSFNETDLDKARTLKQEAIITQEKITTLKETIESKQIQINTLLKDIHPDVEHFYRISDDATTLNKAYRDTNEHTINELTQTIITLKETIQPLKEALDKLTTKRQKHKKHWYLIVPLFLLLITKLKINRINKKLTPLNKDNLTLTNRLETEMVPKETVLNLLDKYNQPTIEAFDAYYKTLEKSHHLQTQVNTLNSEQTIHQTTLSTLTTTQQSNKDALTTIYNRYGVTTLSELITYQKHHQNYQGIKSELSHLRKEINALLGHQTFEALKSSIDFNQALVSTDNKDALKTTQATLLSDLKTLEKTINENDKLIETTLAPHRDIEIIEYDIAQANQKVIDYKARLNTINHAITFIENAKASIEENFAPILSDTIADYVHTLTHENYTTIKVSKTLDFKVIDPKTGHLKPPLYFSSGTKDQIYLAMRLGILKTLKYEHYPLFFDDVFVTYDQPRLKSALNLLITLSKERQILLFTCHTREQSTLKDTKNTTIITL